MARTRSREVKVQLSKLGRFIDKKNTEADTKLDLLDSEYWFAVTFENREQVEAFCRWLGPTFDGKYVDGLALAERLGVDVGPRQRFPVERGFSKRLAELARDVPPKE